MLTRVRVPPVGKNQALRRAYELHFPALLRFCVLLTQSRHEGEDLAQEAFVRLAGKLPSVSAAAIPSYLRSTAVNLRRSQLRRRRPWATLESIEEPFREANRWEEYDDLHQAIKKLSVRQRACLVLRYYEDLSEREIASTLSISTGTVKRYISRAMQRLRKELDHAE